MKLQYLTYPKWVNQLMAVGNTELLNMRTIGICGTRNPSLMGKEMARGYSKEAVHGYGLVDYTDVRGYAVVSGYANGIDLTAHYTALKKGGYTIIVLPYGLNHFSIKKELVSVWDWKRVLVVSQFKPSASWKSYRAMERNKLVIALSESIIAFEPKSTGGTINAIKVAIESKVPVYCPIHQGMGKEELAIANEYNNISYNNISYNNISSRR